MARLIKNSTCVRIYPDGTWVHMSAPFTAKDANYAGEELVRCNKADIDEIAKNYNWDRPWNISMTVRLIPLCLISPEIWDYMTEGAPQAIHRCEEASA